MNTRLENVLTMILTLAAVVMAGAVVKREISRSSGVAQGAPPREALFHEEWIEARAVGIELANPEAALQIVEFLDLECPACALYHAETLGPFVRLADSLDYSLVIVHLPLRGHTFAVPAARAAECAQAQGAFVPFVDAALKRQWAFASSPWMTLATEAGVRDSARFASCMSDSSSLTRITGGVQLAARMSVHATPTIMVNGWVMPTPPSRELLLKFVQELKAGRDVHDVVLAR